MSAPDLTPGFFGKIPATGDFVGRRLPADFVQVWDRWVARHLAPFQASGVWAEHVGLRFLLGPAALWPMAGIVLPSSDRVGRRFPLTVAASIRHASAGLARSAAPWFEQVEAAAQAAQRGEATADELEAELVMLPFPSVEADGEVIKGMAFWTDASELLGIDPDAPRAALEHLLAASWETS